MEPGGVAAPAGLNLQSVRCAKLGTRCMPKYRLRSSRLLEPRKRARNLRDWLRWRDACQRIYDHFGAWELVLIELAPKLKSDQIQSFIRIVDLRNSKHHDHKLSRKFWKEIEIWAGAGLELNWPKWIAKKRSENSAPDWWPPNDALFSRFVFLKPDDVDRHWPIVGESSGGERSQR